MKWSDPVLIITQVTLSQNGIIIEQLLSLLIELLKTSVQDIFSIIELFRFDSEKPILLRSNGGFDLNNNDHYLS